MSVTYVVNQANTHTKDTTLDEIRALLLDSVRLSVVFLASPWPEILSLGLTSRIAFLDLSLEECLEICTHSLFFPDGKRLARDYKLVPSLAVRAARLAEFAMKERIKVMHADSDPEALLITFLASRITHVPFSFLLWDVGVFVHDLAQYHENDARKLLTTLIGSAARVVTTTNDDAWSVQKLVEPFFGRKLIDRNSDNGGAVAPGYGTRQDRVTLQKHGHGPENLAHQSLMPMFRGILEESSEIDGPDNEVAIILATYRPKLELLEKAIRSIIQQRFTHWKLHLVQDGDEVDLSGLIRTFKEPRLLYSTIPHAGKAQAINSVLKNIHSKYIAYMDDDDIWYENHLEEGIVFMIKNGIKFLHTDADEVLLEHTEHGYVERSRRMLNRGIISDKSLWYVSHINALHERALLDLAGDYDVTRTYYIDWDMFQRLAHHARPFHLNVRTADHFIYQKTGAEIENTISSAHGKDPAQTERDLLAMFRRSFELIDADGYAEILLELASYREKAFILERERSSAIHAADTLSEVKEELRSMPQKLVERTRELATSRDELRPAQQQLGEQQERDRALSDSLAESGRDLEAVRVELNSVKQELEEQRNRNLQQSNSLSGITREQEELRRSFGLMAARSNPSLKWGLAWKEVRGQMRQHGFRGLLKALRSMCRFLAWKRAGATSRARRRLVRSGLFDAQWYLGQNPDVALAGVDPVVHYLKHGAEEGRDPNAYFSSRWYLDNNPDVRMAGTNPLLHYITCGAEEGRDPSAFFRSRWYLDTNPDVRMAGVNPLSHYLSHGAREGRRSCPRREGNGSAKNHHGKPMPKVSVIVPNYRHEPFLRRRLDSIYGQTYKNIEVILLDDCSPDNSRILLDEYAAAHAGITRTIYNGTNSGGPFHQWAKGIDAAQGELVWIAESDDQCDSNFLETLVRCFDDEAVLLAYAHSVFIDTSGNRLDFDFAGYISDLGCGSKWNHSYVETAHNEVNCALGIKNTIPNASGVVFRRPIDMPLLKDKAWLSMAVAGDWVFYLHLIRGGKVAYSTETSNYFRRYEGSTADANYKKEVFYRELGLASRTVAALYAVPKSTLEKAEKTQRKLYKQMVGRSEEEFSRWYDYPSILQAREHRVPNILVSTMGFYPGGTEILPIRLANEFKRQGLSVLMLNTGLYPGEGGVRRLLRNDVPLIEAPSAEDMKRVIQEFGIEALNTHHWDIQKFPLQCPGVFADLRTHVASLHGMIEHGDAFGATRDQLRKADRAVTTWVYTAEKNLGPFIEAELFSPSSPRFVKLPNGLEPRPIEPVSRASLGIPEDAFALCCVSRAIPDKGWEEMIRVVERARHLSCRDIRLVLVGNGPVYDDYCHTGVPDFVSLVGFNENSVGCYAAADMGIMLTKFKSESFPLTIVDCFFAGKPYIATDVGDIKNMLTVEQGLAGGLVELDRWEIPIEPAAEMVAAFAMDEQKYRQALERVPDAANRFRIDVVADGYIALFIR